MSKTFTQADVASHNKGDSLWIVVDGDVYDVTKFQEDHPGMSLRLILLLVSASVSQDVVREQSSG
jgi:cytochrome b involved in lipid metabolism